MPVVSLTLEETERTILQSVYYKLIDDIAAVIKVPKEAITVLYKDNESALTDARPNAVSTSSPNLPTTGAKRRVQVRVTEEYNEQYLGATAIHQREYLPFFVDHDIDVVIAPIYLQTDVQIEFTYITPSKTEANRIRDDVAMRLHQTRNIGLHEVEYTLIIPTEIEEFIEVIHDYKSRIQPTSLEEYFLSHVSNRVHTLTDLSENNVRIGLYEKQTRIVGSFDFSALPERVEIENESNTYKFSFTYKLTLGLPKAISVRYPVMVANQVLPAKYVQFIEDHKLNLLREYKRDHNYQGYSNYSFSMLESSRQLENKIDINLPINVPLFDDFSLKQGHKGYGIIISFLTQVDEEDSKTLLNLNDLDPYYIPELLLDYIRAGERQYITKPYASFIYLGLHQEGRHMDNSILEVLPDLTVRSSEIISLYTPSRVTLSMCVDISMLLPEAIERLLGHRELYELFISEYISARNNFKNYIEGGRSGHDKFLDVLIDMLYRLLDAGDIETLRRILCTLARDTYMAIEVGRMLRFGHPSLITLLERQVDISIDPSIHRLYLRQGCDGLFTGPRDGSSEQQTPHHPAQYRVDRGVMRTVMTNFIIAQREDGRG